ncbi:hypothetical protein EVAR_38204_1 [Eumeta japonica]|uniref:Uncharacterized protein n=1 Tax=Eumeta variegata TaxID=151549 RepID=A0A4C1WDG2_EUMVA|nr:hypothetical protein EVAR_38204_1 [Eumeta japonica]
MLVLQKRAVRAIYKLGPRVSLRNKFKIKTEVRTESGIAIRTGNERDRHREQDRHQSGEQDKYGANWRLLTTPSATGQLNVLFGSRSVYVELNYFKSLVDTVEVRIEPDTTRSDAETDILIAELPPLCAD